LSVEILAAVVLVGGLVDLALLLFAMHSGRDPASSAERGDSSAGGRGEATAARGARRRTLFVAAADADAGGTSPDPRPGVIHVTERRREPMPMAERLSASAAPPPPAAAPNPRVEDPAPDATAETANRPAGAERGPAILARMSHASQAFGVADPDLPVEDTHGVEGALGWARIMEVEGARLLRYRRPVTAIIAEVDGLQRLVDRLGEEPVRRLLVVVGDMFRREARSSDWVAAIAPGRYAVLLTETDEAGAAYYAERVRRVCEPWLGSAAVPLAPAIGWSRAPASADLQFALHRAEERMHADRRAAGRWARRLTGAAAGDRATDGAAVSAVPAGTVPSTGTDQVGIAPSDDGPEGSR
jgi:GGDEF domain-containing protein